MERQLCAKCQLVNVPANHICFDCWGITPQQRQNRWEESERFSDHLKMKLRDAFAMRILPTVILESDRGGSDEHGAACVGPVAPDAFYTDRAYAWADLMLESRKKPLPESG